MLLKKSFSTADQNFCRPLMRFSDKYVRGTSSPSEKLTGGFDNGLGAILIGENSLASFLSKKSPEGISGLFQQHRLKPERPLIALMSAFANSCGHTIEQAFDCNVPILLQKSFCAGDQKFSGL